MDGPANVLSKKAVLDQRQDERARWFPGEGKLTKDTYWIVFDDVFVKEWEADRRAGRRRAAAERQAARQKVEPNETGRMCIEFAL